MISRLTRLFALIIICSFAACNPGHASPHAWRIPDTVGVSIGGSGLMAPLGLGIKQESGAWSPVLLPNLDCWLRADLGITLSGGNVQTWADQSGVGDSNRNVIGSSGTWPTINSANSAYNNQRTVHFTGSEVLISGTWSSAQALPETDWIAGNNNGAATNQYYADGIVGNARVISNHLLAQGMELFNGTVLSGSQSEAAGTPLFFGAYFDSSTSCKIYDSSTTALVTGSCGTTTGTRTGLTVGNGGAHTTGLVGDIAEVVIVGGAMSAGNMTNLLGYFRSRYGNL